MTLFTKFIKRGEREPHLSFVKNYRTNRQAKKALKKRFTILVSCNVECTCCNLNIVQNHKTTREVIEFLLSFLTVYQDYYYFLHEDTLILIS